MRQPGSAAFPQGQHLPAESPAGHEVPYVAGCIIGTTLVWPAFLPALKASWETGSAPGPGEQLCSPRWERGRAGAVRSTCDEEARSRRSDGKGSPGLALC